ncbi:helix-turn-helix transcriptional regulator [Bosea sp. (in: a-proteobacteria)]|uniref:ArsR/SmtB family transcription factor n=1 Tax=Bosea sp. (in: a-proteobacteria) TaxID=1871050 RepID=UPI0026073ADE|nr:metalloregulator ArsR/SmtB family transcription factor [Bosea sp. (in: a-proteobacteria)]MCO5092973.1 metalloregulator ArsR/SmtB family transcription factor [Bosea sp. (in: a-proteobacteria)]
MGEKAGSSSKAKTLSPQDLIILSETFRLLGDPSRLKILLHCSEGSKSVSEIAEELELSQSLVSHHLRLLRGARLVRGTRRSKNVFYEIADDHVSDMLRDMISHIGEENSQGSFA